MEALYPVSGCAIKCHYYSKGSCTIIISALDIKGKWWVKLQLCNGRIMK